MSPNTRWRASSAMACALLAGAALLAALPSARADTTLAKPPHVTDYVEGPRLGGSGRLTWWGFQVYDAHLFVPSRGLDPANFTRTPFVLELTYKRELSGKAIADASRDEILRLGFGSADARTRWHAEMARLFPDVKAGSTLAGVNLPGKGVRFYADGKRVGSIDEPEFARAFFAIWLDERTAAPRLRDSLLQEARAPRGPG